MKLILNEYVQHLGDAGDKVTVAAGYARNYLLPRKLAFEATAPNIKTYENNLKQRARKLTKMRQEAEAQKGALEGAGVLEFVRKAGEMGKLFGSVTSADIAAALAEKGFEVDKRRINISNPIKTLGETIVEIKLHAKVTASVTVLVKQEEQPAEPAEEQAPTALAEEGAEQNQEQSAPEDQ